MTFGSVEVETLLRNKAMTDSSNDVMNANKAPAARAGATTGNVTATNALAGCAPSVAAARSSVTSTLRNAAETISSTVGVASTVSASANAQTLPMRCRRANRKYIATAVTITGTMSGKSDAT